MPLADVVVHRVVARRHLEGAGAEILVDRFVADDRQPASDQRQGRGLADQLAKAGIARVHRDCGVGQHRLRSHGGDGDVTASLDRVFDEVQDIVMGLPLDLEV